MGGKIKKSMSITGKIKNRSTKKKHNPQDTTFRNLNALKKRVLNLEKVLDDHVERMVFVEERMEDLFNVLVKASLANLDKQGKLIPNEEIKRELYYDEAKGICSGCSNIISKCTCAADANAGEI